MLVREHGVISEYDWEIEACCARCGSRQYLIFEKVAEKIYCGPCLQFLRRHQKQQFEMNKFFEEDDFLL